MNRGLMVAAIILTILGIPIIIYGWVAMSMGHVYFGMFLLVISFILGKLGMPKPKQTTLSPENNPLDILKTRLAKGEISKEEFDELSKRL